VNTIVKNILSKCEVGGYEAYLIGGCVRDFILNKDPHDLDIATNAPKEFIEKELRGKNISNNMEIDVFDIKGIQLAQFRTESAYDGRKPSQDPISITLESDCSRRDFTINALAMDKYENIIDFYNGEEDAKNKIVRCIGKPECRYQEDYLRMLRAIRFATTYDFTIEEKTGWAIKALSHNIQQLAGERILGEFKKVASFGSKAFANYFRMLDKYNLLIYILPEIKALQGLQHKEKHHPEGDAYEHTIKAIDSVIDCYDIRVLLSILFHDCGKVVVYDSLNLTFKGHDKEALNIIKRVANRLKFSNELKDCILYCAKEHMKMHNLSNMKKIKVCKLISSPYFDILTKVYIADYFVKSLDYPIACLRYIAELKESMHKSAQGNMEISLAITGKDVLKYVCEGKIVGEILRHLREIVLNDPNMNTEDLLSVEIEKYIVEKTLYVRLSSKCHT